MTQIHYCQKLAQSQLEKSLIPLSTGLMELICVPFVNNAYWLSLMHKIPDKRIDDTEIWQFRQLHSSFILQYCFYCPIKHRFVSVIIFIFYCFLYFNAKFDIFAIILQASFDGNLLNQTKDVNGSLSLECQLFICGKFHLSNMWIVCIEGTWYQETSSISLHQKIRACFRGIKKRWFWKQNRSF